MRRLQEAVEENESIQKNLKKLQLQLKQLKALHASAGIVVNPSDGAVVADVSFDQTPQVQQMKEEILEEGAPDRAFLLQAAAVGLGSFLFGLYGPKRKDD